MVMFKAKFRPLADKPRASDGERPRSAGNDRPRVQRNLQQQQQQQQQPQPQPQPDRKAPPIEEERGPQHPVKEPGPAEPGERV